MNYVTEESVSSVLVPSSTVKPSRCIICGTVSSVYYNLDGKRVRVKREFEEDLNLMPECSPGELEFGVNGDAEVEEARTHECETGLFYCFLTAMKAGRSKGKILWNFETEPVPFCTSCEIQVRSLKKLCDKLEKIGHLLSNMKQVLKEKMQMKEETFQNDNVYKEDERYYWIRQKIIGAYAVKWSPSGHPRPQRVSRMSAEDFEMTLETNVTHRHLRSPCSSLETKLEFEDLPAHESTTSPSSPTPRYPEAEPEYHHRNNRSTSEAEEGTNTNQKKKVIRKLQRNMRKNPSKNKLSRSKRINKPNAWKQVYKEESSVSDFDDSYTPPSRNKDVGGYVRQNEVDDLEKEYAAFLGKDGKLATYARMNKQTGKYSFMHITFDVIDPETLKCMKCETIVNTRNQAKLHVTRSHTNRFKCPHCDLRAGTRYHLKIHILHVHEGKARKRVPCDICGKPLENHQLREHRFSHCSAEELQQAKETGELEFLEKEKPKNFQCGQCGKCFRMRHNLVEHEAKVHTNNPSSEQSDSVSTELDKRVPMICPHCGKPYATHTGLRLHIRLVHSDPLELQFACTYCEKRFVTQKSLSRHLPIHTGNRPFQCKQCPRQFITEDALTLHMKHHNNERDHKCSVCPMAFTTPSMLKRHFNTYHAPGSNPKRKPYVRGPEKCQFRVHSGTTNAFVGSQERVQLFEKLPRQCPNCSRSFQYPSQLKNHINVHHTPGRQVGRKPHTAADYLPIPKPRQVPSIMQQGNPGVNTVQNEMESPS